MKSNQLYFDENRMISEKALNDIKDHMENTAQILIKCYTLKQLSIMDGVKTEQIKRNGKYLPVRVDTKQNAYEYRNRRRKKPYQIKWIRVDEIKFIYAKRNRGKKLVSEY